MMQYEMDLFVLYKWCLGLWMTKLLVVNISQTVQLRQQLHFLDSLISELKMKNRFPTSLTILETIVMSYLSGGEYWYIWNKANIVSRLGIEHKRVQRSRIKKKTKQMLVKQNFLQHHIWIFYSIIHWYFLINRMPSISNRFI